jgi:hypothetical protein
MREACPSRSATGQHQRSRRSWTRCDACRTPISSSSAVDQRLSMCHGSDCQSACVSTSRRSLRKNGRSGLAPPSAASFRGPARTPADIGRGPDLRPVPRVFPHQLIETRGIVPARPDRRLGENDEAVTPAGCRKPGGQRHALALQLKELPRVVQAIGSARQGIATLCRRSLVQFPRREARDVSTTSEPVVRIIPATSEST